MSAAVVNNKRAFQHDDSETEHVAKRFKCPSSPLVIQGMGKKEVIDRLQKMFPRVPTGIINSILKSCNYSVELAADSLHRFTSQISEDEASASEMMSSSSSRAPMNNKRRFTETEEVQAAAASSSQDHLWQWSDRIVGSLKGAPSVDDAKVRTHQILQNFEQEQLQKQEQSGDRLAGLLNANQVLFRALKNTNEQNTELRQKAEHAENLHRQLTETQEQLRRAEQANRTLQWHIAQGGAPNSGGGGFGHGPPGVF